jgi:hypothetical protein
MTPEGAKALAKALADTSANPPVYTKVATNGPSHESVVHVTYGQPKPVEKIDKNNRVEKVTTPDRPAPETIS